MAKTVKQLDAEIAAISSQRKALKGEMRKHIAERDEILAREAAAKRVAGMSGAEREAMANAVLAARK